MTALRVKAGRNKKKVALVGATLTATIASLLVVTDFPRAFASDGGGSVALAELAARSPGMRVGGIALKSKTRRAASVGRVARSPAPAADTPTAPMASVLSAGPLGPDAAPAGLGSFPSDFVQPAAPGVAAAPVVGGVPGGGIPGIGAGPVIIGGGGGGTPGGGTGVVPTPTPTPTASPTPVPTASPTPTPTEPVPAVPEPGTWLTLILGFGMVGAGLRRRRRLLLA